MSVLKGVGDSGRWELAELGIETVLDLVTHYPRRYIDGTRLVPIAELAAGDKASVLAEVTRVSRPPSGYGRGRRRARRGWWWASPTTRGRLTVVFFNQTWRASSWPSGTLALFYGTVGSYRGALQLGSPTAEVLRAAGGRPADEDGEGTATGRVFPVYPADRQGQARPRPGIGRYVGEALDRAGHLRRPPARRLAGPVRAGRPDHGLQPHPPACHHGRAASRPVAGWPSTSCSACSWPWCCARRLQEDARGIRHVVARHDGAPTLVDGSSRACRSRHAAQRRAIGAIRDDLAGVLPMHRLLQGDVGAGKTVVAVAAMLVGVEGGHQGALMAPTEVLAEQHATEVRRSRRADGGRPVDARGTAPAAGGPLDQQDPGRRAGRDPRRTGRRHGRPPHRHPCPPHRPGGVPSLGVVVIDEQHRFGVEQRAALRAKGRGADGPGATPTCW